MNVSEASHFLEKIRAILLQPRKFFESLSNKNEIPREALKFFLLFGLLTVPFAMVAGASIITELVSAVLGLAFVLLSLAVASALVFAFAKRVFKASFGYWQVLRVFLYVYAIVIFVNLIIKATTYAIPEIYPALRIILALATIYINFYVLVVGVSITGRMSFSRALASIFVPILIFTVIIGSALYALGVFSPSPKAILVDKSATGFPSFQINDWTLSAEDGALNLVLQNKYGEPITITSVNAARVGSVATCNSAALGPPLAKDSVIILITNEGSCAAGLASGEPYTLNVAVSFILPTGLSHTEVGTLHCGNFPTCETRVK